jgi:hypothetical protein
METIKEAVDHYGALKKEGKLSISEIRTELKSSPTFSDAEISKICRIISDQELDAMHEPNKNPMAFLSSIWVSYILAAIFLYLTYRSYLAIEDLNAKKALGPVEPKMIIWRYAMLVGSVFFVLRNALRIIKHIGKKGK